MTEFENILRDNMADAGDDLIYVEGYTPAEIDAYRLGVEHTITEAVGLHLVEVALEDERQRAGARDLGDTFEEVRTTFAVEWEQGTRIATDLRVVDETIERTFAVLDAMEDCE